MNKIPPIQEWKQIFVDTSFIINCLSNLPNEDNSNYNSVKRAKALLNYFEINPNQKVRWVTSSIVLSELTKLPDENLIEAVANIFNNADIEIVNFTNKEARFMVKEFTKFIDDNHIEKYIKDLQKSLGELGVFNPKNFISSDARIIACAKSKRCDVVLTSDRKTFYPIAQKVELPVMLTSDLPLDLHDNIDHKKSF